MKTAMRSVIIPLLLFAVAASLPAKDKPSLLVISIDGMRPDYVTKANEHGLKIPTLQAIMQHGTYATGVRGVLPTVTYPSHTTLLTGVWPSRHGIYSNTTFDPMNKNIGGWYWYSQDVKVPTLWQVAAKAGLSVGSVSWPGSVSAQGVKYLIPEYWRAATDDDLKLIGALSTPGLFQHLQQTAGPYTTDLNQALEGDRYRTNYSVAILKENKPDLMTVHLAALDHLEHAGGPFSAEANATLEEIDGLVKRIADAMRESHPNAAICIVSDHGFTRVDHHLHIARAFVEAKLIELDAKNASSSPKIVSWKASPWLDGGSAAIVLKNPKDEATRNQVKELLEKLAADPQNGINQVLDKKAIAARGGAAEADFWIDMKSNYALDAAMRDPLVEETKVVGTHGYSPDNPELQASFFIEGPKIKPGVNLGRIDMRSIAPTLAVYLGTRLDNADVPAMRLDKSH
jgi:predicted AlkP superfamily pyrophosphatase or phosphodiesterase